jgi:HAMP domain-containing protein
MPAKVNHEKLAEAFFIWAENALGLTKLERLRSEARQGRLSRRVRSPFRSKVQVCLQ